MKTSITKLICSVLFTGLLFSSCLGDGDNSITMNKDYVFITNLNGTKVGATASYNTYIVTDQIQQNSTLTNECYIMGYKIDTKNAAGNNTYLAEDYGQPMKRLTQTSGTSGAPNIGNDFTPTTFGVTYFTTLMDSKVSRKNFFGDRWVFAAQANLSDNDTPEMYFFYDPENQKEVVNDKIEEIGKNKMIIDVRFKKTSSTGGTLNSKIFECVGDMTLIRYHFQNSSGKLDFNGEKALLVPIKFRFFKTVTEDGKEVEKETTIGNWNTDNTGLYAMYFTTGA